jgi:outer membrane receptor protein involved in Fe transport
MKKYTRSFATLLVIACPWSLLAQMATPPASTTTTTTTTTTVATPTTEQVNTAGASNDVVKLNPFEVSSEKDRGYAATETLAGTRIRTNLDDVAASITVLNKNFLDDIGALDIGTMLQYTPSAQVAGTEGTYSGVGSGQTYSEAANMAAPRIRWAFWGAAMLAASL